MIWEIHLFVDSVGKVTKNSYVFSIAGYSLKNVMFVLNITLVYFWQNI